jgi:hypothetical protein
MSDDEANIKLPGSKKIDVKLFFIRRSRKLGQNWKLMSKRL